MSAPEGRASSAASDKPHIPLSLPPFFEQATLFLSIVKWTLLATLVGAIVGAATALFLNSLELSTQAVQQAPNWYFLLPLGGLGAGWLIHRGAPEAEGHGTEQVITAVHERQGRIALRVTPVKWFATVLTIATGGSAGKEGPSAQIGGSLASWIAGVFWLRPEDRRKLVICGISAGFAAVFGTPIAGALFGVEVLFLGQLLYDVLYPSFVAGIIAYQTARALGIVYFHHTLVFVPEFTQVRFLKMIVVGILCGLCALLLIEALRYAQKAFARLRLRPMFKPAAGGALMLLLTLPASIQYLGLGTAQIEASVSGGAAPPWAFAWKILFTSVTLGAGGSGGIITPIFYIGATFGSAIAHLLRMDPASVASLGMVGVLAGAANTPIAASIMAIEFFGPRIGPFACIVCITAFLVSGHRSVYPSQRLGMRKSEALKVPMQEIVGEIEKVELQEDAERLLGRIRRVVKRWAARS